MPIFSFTYITFYNKAHSHNHWYLMGFLYEFLTTNNIINTLLFLVVVLFIYLLYNNNNIVCDLIILLTPACSMVYFEPSANTRDPYQILQR